VHVKGGKASLHPRSLRGCWAYGVANRAATGASVATEADWARLAAIQPCMNTVAAASADGCGFGGKGMVVVVGARVVAVEVGATEVVVVGMAFGGCVVLQALAATATATATAPATATRSVMCLFLLII
jgi:hypothetical protein